MGFDLGDAERDSRKIWRRRVSAEDPIHASNFCPDGDCGKYVGAAGMPRHAAEVHPGMIGPEKTIRKGRAKNMPDDRLLGRREYLAKNLSQGLTGNSDDSRLGFSLKAGELGQVETELEGRGLLQPDQRRTLNPRQFGGQ